MCFWRAESDHTSFKAFAAESQMPVYSCYDRGEASHRAGRSHEEFRVSFDVSDAEWETVGPQAADAVAFLREWKAEIQRLCRTHRVSALALDFAVFSCLYGDTGEQCETYPAELISLMGELNVELRMSVYDRTLFEDARDLKDV